MYKTFLIITGLILISCGSDMLVKEGMGKAEVKIVLGTADSVVAMMPVEDVYTNKLIKMEAWHYGKDTVLLFANDKLVKGLKN